MVHPPQSTDSSLEVNELYDHHFESDNDINNTIKLILNKKLNFVLYNFNFFIWMNE